MALLNVEEIQQDFARCLERVQAGETIVILQCGKAVAEIKPVQSSVKQRPLGLCTGEFLVPVNFDEPLPDHIIQEFEGKVNYVEMKEEIFKGMSVDDIVAEIEGFKG
ncbi:MAG: type II toxin-antitoxin system Phd/YefM family antitoxin [Candidatus Brocadiae bacterium]|nr:type II toxin-antitoxin system Phd/YefM family antitoxin [Candidatus Brocadiia bacterium]